VLKRKIELPPEHLYPADEWRIVEARYSDEFVGLTETVFSLGNGFVGARGSFEEGRPALVPGTFVNGFHETWPVMHAEGAHLSFAPRLPHAWHGLAFSLRFRGRQIRVRLTHDEESCLIEEGAPLEISVRGEPHLLSPGTTVAIKLTPP